ncbi:E3 ubiquitin-protein ligase sina-like isoform X1 [Bacillus rossius redtenbacheri]|uniref:E3 ubiquitin-protein ligase sina-like isoform X1 n=1 Tax=Bacillus rossius redtenbacheri TaxID=93214 RepID=UPI002FDE9935
MRKKVYLISISCIFNISQFHFNTRKSLNHCSVRCKMSSLALSQSLQATLRCPSCDNYMRAPIRQCASGHSVCGPCVSEKPDCPRCRRSFIETRNFGLQAIAERVKLPCPNSCEGCVVTCLQADLGDHLGNCVYTKHRCKVQVCKWTGRLSLLLEHVQKLHRKRNCN